MPDCTTTTFTPCEARRLSRLLAGMAKGGEACQGSAHTGATRDLIARAIAAAGAFAVVIEGVMEPLARAITAELSCPTIGIGASPACDGQVLVVDDMLGMFERVPRFVRRFDDVASRITAAAQAYAAEVRARTFPGPAELYQPRAGAGKAKA